MKRYVLVLGLLMSVANVHADLYRSIDKDGKVHYGDRPVGDAADFEELKTGRAPVPEESLSYEMRKAKENFPITLYVSASCGSLCNQARAVLTKRGIPFTEKNLTTQEDMEAYKKLSGVEEVPTMTVGRNWVKGYMESQWNSELDIAGYPRSAPYRASQPVQPATKSE